MKVTGSTRLAGLFGYPVSHTVSPRMHNAAFEYLGLDIIYLPFSINPQDLKDAVNSLRVLGFIGINVTIPHKRTIMQYLDKISFSAEKIGAVNTVVVKRKNLAGHNTDGLGFIKSLEKDYSYKLKGKTMFLLGAGGAGRAVAVESALKGLKKIFIADKMQSRMRDLTASVPKCEAIAVKTRNQMREAISLSDIIVNASPVGLHLDDPVSIPPEWIPKGRLVYDLIYNPRRTKLLKGAKNCRIVNGLGMLLYQGASSFELWTGIKAPVGIMRKAIDQRSEAPHLLNGGWGY